MAEKISEAILPFAVALIGIFFLFPKRDFFSAFIRGAAQGVQTTLHLLPTLSILLVGNAMLKASGFIEWFGNLLTPIAKLIGLPPQILPFLFTRPLSGSASMASFIGLLQDLGADSFPALCASVIFGSSDTLVYVISVYTTSVGIKKTGWTFPVAILVMLFCWFFSCFLCRLCFT